MKASLQWEVTEFLLSVPLGPTAKFHVCSRKCCRGEWSLLSTLSLSCMLTQKESGFPLLKADSQQWEDELQCHMQKTRIKALLAWFTPIPSLLSYPAGFLGVRTPHIFGYVSPGSSSWELSPGHNTEKGRAVYGIQDGSLWESQGEHWQLLPLPGYSWGKYTAPHGDQTHCSWFCLYLAHQPPKCCWLRCSARASSNLPSGQGWNFTSEHVQSSGW